MVSIKGPSDATNPSLIGYLVLTAACAIEAEPSPASLENTARLIPQIKTVATDPPATAVPEKASLKINWITLGISLIFSIHIVPMYNFI